MNKKLTLSKNNKILVGVCGGIANYFSIDAALVRIIWVVLSFIVLKAIPLSIILYLICWLIMSKS